MRIVKIVRKESTAIHVYLEITFEVKRWFKVKTYTKTCTYDASTNSCEYSDSGDVVYVNGHCRLLSVRQFVDSHMSEVTFK